MKIRIAALVVLGVLVVTSAVGAIMVGSTPLSAGPVPTLPLTTPFTQEQTQPPTQPSTQPQTQPSADTPNHLHFLAAGDNLVYPYVRRYANILAGGNGVSSQYKTHGFDYAPMYQAIRPYLDKADLAFYNQESLVWDDRADASMRATLGDQMVEMGFNVVNIANNDMLSSGEQGLLDSIAYWQTKKNVALLGANVGADTADHVTVIEKNNIKIAFLSYTDGEVTDEEGNKVLQLPEGSTLRLPLIDPERMTADVAAARELADLVFVYCHWGQVNQSDRNSRQSQIAQHLVDLNVDVILGSHPNVIQEMKWKSRPDGGRTLIVYSMGNLLSAQPMNNNLLGGLVTMDIDKDPDRGVCTISNVQFVPVFTHYDENYKQICLYLLDAYDQAKLDTHGSSILVGKGRYEYFIRSLQKYIGSGFLDKYYTDYAFTDPIT